ncbi:MAG: hypothetical protein GX767_00170 [Firmicutes bacterium]|nr:hypothetical protein [Bacillota bacterium]
MEEAAQFLGKFLRRTGRVVRGDGRGKLLGYPTANLSCNPELIYPANGVYLTMTQIDNSCYASLTNVGVKPTFSDNNSLVMETHILNFNGEIYFKEIFIFFLERIRPEKKFANESLLKKQIEEDIQLAYKVIANKYERQLQLNKVTL